MKTRILDILLLIFKILLPISLVLITVLFTKELVDAHYEDLKHVGENVYIQTYGLSFASLVIVGIMFNGIVSLISLIFLIVSIIYKSSAKRKANIIYFILFLFIPVLNELLFVLIGQNLQGML